MGVSSVLMVQGRVGDLGEASPPVGLRGGAPVGRLRDEVPQNLKHLMSFTEFYKCPMNFILKFNILILTEKLQPHHFTVTETLNSDEYMTSLPLWVKRRHIGLCKI